MKGIGDTPLVRLKRTENAIGAKASIFAKIEGKNLGGSIKDRVALAIIADAERSGRLTTGGAIVEATSGNTGIGLALVAKARGYRAVIVMPENMSKERLALIESYGAEVVLTPEKDGMSGAVQRAGEIVKSTPNSVLADQFNNSVCVAAHYETTAAEIFVQTGGQVDIFVACVGTGGTLTGVGRYLKEKNPRTKIVAVEPAYSPLLSKGVAGEHKIQGIGANFVPSVLDRTVYDEVLTVTDEEAFAEAKRLYKEEGLYVGISSGAAAMAAKRLAKDKKNAGKKIVVIFPDEGSRYESILGKSE